MPNPSIEFLHEIGLFFDTPSGLPRDTSINIEDTNDGPRGAPAGYASWKAFQIRIKQAIPERYEQTDIWKDCIDALNSPYCTNPPPTSMAQKRTLLGLLNYIGKKHKDLSQNAYTWQWLGLRVYDLRTRWLQGDNDVLIRRRYPDLWNEGNSAGFDKKILEICNKYLKKHYPECPEILYHKSFYYAYGFKGALAEVHHVIYHHDPSLYREDIQYYPKEKAASSLSQGYIREYEGKLYTKDNWFKVRTFNKKGEIGLEEIFWPKQRDEFTKCQCCNEFITKKSMVEVLELETTLCPPCAAKPRTNKKHTPNTVYGDYHGHPWWNFFVRRSHGEWESLPMGIEIEMLTRMPKDATEDLSPPSVAWAMYNDQLVLNPNWNEFYCERDGSLSDGRGIELISNPMTLGFAQDYWEKMLPVLRKYCVGWNTPKHGDKEHSYGIHLTTNRKYWTDLQLARLIKFIDRKENALFMYCMAQRNYNYGSKKIPIGGGVYQTLSGAVSMVGKKIVGSKDRYSSVNIKSKNLVELRIFASTLQQDSFLKNYEFLDSFWNWARVSPFNVDYQNYLAWVSLQPLTYKRYPHLLKHLLKDYFYFKVGGGKAVKQENIFKQFIKMIPVGQQTLDLEVTGEVLTNTIQDQEDIECV